VVILATRCSCDGWRWWDPSFLSAKIKEAEEDIWSRWTRIVRWRGTTTPNTRRESTRSAPGINGWGRGYHNLSAGDKLSSLLFVLMNSEVVSRSTGLDVTKFVDDHTNVPGSYHQIGVVGVFRHYLGSIH